MAAPPKKERVMTSSPCFSKGNTKIMATLGPASDSLERIRELVKAGARIFRLNFSHGLAEEHRARFDRVRAVEKEYGHPLPVFMDLQGPKLRIGKFQEPSVTLTAQALFTLDLDPQPGDVSRVCLPHPEILSALKQGTELLLDDGRVRLVVEKCGVEAVQTRVLTPGVLSNHKGLNVPGLILPISALTAKDRQDLQVGLSWGIDGVALSFVQKAEDLEELRDFIGVHLPKNLPFPQVLAKIEKPMALEHLSKIIELSDVVMVARGDLGVEIPPEEVPTLQKRIVKECRQAGKPVVVATQLLDSMVRSPSPTRAEASDVATAIYEGVDGILFSAETASGAYPIEAVTIAQRIIHHVEKDPLFVQYMDQTRPEPGATTGDALTAAARLVAHLTPVAAIVTFTHSGKTTLRAARERPEAPILGLTPQESTARALAFAWGVYPAVIKNFDQLPQRGFPEMMTVACHAAKEWGLAQQGDHILITAGIPFGEQGTTNLLQLADVSKVLGL